MNAQEIIERIMTMHWDMAACHCWVCDAGTALGYHAVDIYLPHKSPVKFGHVKVDLEPNPLRAKGEKQP